MDGTSVGAQISRKALSHHSRPIQNDRKNIYMCVEERHVGAAKAPLITVSIASENWAMKKEFCTYGRRCGWPRAHYSTKTSNNIQSRVGRRSLVEHHQHGLERVMGRVGRVD